jgi:hypothetical protein
MTWPMPAGQFLTPLGVDGHNTHSVIAKLA